jgi:hypothetical protein
VKAWRVSALSEGARTASVDAAVFDYGGVLTTSVPDSIAAWLDRDGVDPASFSRTLKAWLSRSAPDGTPIHRLETGELRLFAQMRPDQAMFDLVQDVKAAGVWVALLSNSWGNTYPRERIDAVFNGSSHRGQKAIDRLAEQFPNAQTLKPRVRSMLTPILPIEESIAVAGEVVAFGD